MSGHTITQLTTASAPSVSPSRAARELELKRGEFDLAVGLGCIRTSAGEGGSRRVTRAEIERVRAEDGFPETLRERVEAVGTRDGAGILAVPTARFTRLARLGCIVPVKFYVNRYRAVVWLYLAEELRQFAAGDGRGTGLLARATPCSGSAATAARAAVSCRIDVPAGPEQRAGADAAARTARSAPAQGR